MTDQRVDYYYDTNPCGDGGFSPQNTWGRLTAVNYRLGSEQQGCVYQYSYNQAGRVLQQKMTWRLPDGSSGSSGPQTFALQAAYEWDGEGRMTSQTYPGLGVGHEYTYGFDAMGRTNQMTDTGSSLGVAGATYGVAGEILSLGYFGYSETRQYNAMFQMTRQTVSGAMDLQYIYQAGANNGRVVQSIDGVTGETVDYTYDVWNRLVQAQTEGTAGVQWGQSYTYDGFGNLVAKGATKGSVPTFNTTINPATNGGPTSYPPQQVPDGSTDVEGRPLGSATTSYFYDHAGKRVMTRVDPYGWPNYPYGAGVSYEVAMYGLGGQRMTTVKCAYGADARPNCSMAGNNVYFAGKLVVSRGVVVATDRVGSVRANGNGEQFAYYPYGEERTATADGREKWGTYVRDSVGSDYADQRYYGVGTGRFGVPDPSWLNVNLADPRSWNLYAYVSGDPITSGDPSGLFDDYWNGFNVCALFPWLPGCKFPTGDAGGGPGTGNDQDKGQRVIGSNKNKDKDPYRPECDRSVGTNALKLDWIAAHGDDAATAAAKIGSTEAIILGLSALESGWGTGPFVVNGRNNYFSQHAPAPGSNGSVKENGNTMATYDSYLASALGFDDSSSGALITNVTDPSLAAAILQDAGKYGINRDGTKVANFVKDVANTINGLAIRLDCDR